MDLFSVLDLLGGLALFLFGMHTMSTSLEKVAGGKLEVYLKRMTSTPLKGLALGTIITIIIQSSSAVTVMLVGFVNSGIMTLGQSVGIIMGSNIGTTLTAWILSLGGIESEKVFINLLKPNNFSPVIALLGIILLMASSKQKHKDIGSIFIGFAVLMYGMNNMSDAMAPLASNEAFTKILTSFDMPLIGVLVGLIFTAIIQSSSASVGVLQALAMTGQISFGMAIPIIMGQNIGTCATALISTVGTNNNAKKVSIIHILFNVIGTIIGLCIYGIMRYVFDLTLFEESISAMNIAIVHSIFNIMTTLLLFPFSKLLVRLADIIAKDKLVDSESFYYYSAK